MTITCYKDINGCSIGSDYVVYEENPEDIIDKIYIKDVFYRDSNQIYIEILKENQIHSKKLFKGGL